jgi:hypothetical protein
MAGPTARPPITAPRNEVIKFIRMAFMDMRAEMEPEWVSRILDSWAVDAIFLHTASPQAIRAACGSNTEVTITILHHLDILQPERRPPTEPRSEPGRSLVGKVCTLRLACLLVNAHATALADFPVRLLLGSLLGSVGGRLSGCKISRW